MGRKGERVANTPICFFPPKRGGFTVADHPILLEELQKHKARIEGVIGSKEEKELTKSVDIAYLNMLKCSLENEDFNSADLICGEIQKKQYSEAVQKYVEKLSECIFNLEAEEALKIINELMK